MYEEHRGGGSSSSTTDVSYRRSRDYDDDDDECDSPTISVSPNEFANLLHRTASGPSLLSDINESMRHYYWTSPVVDAVPHLSSLFNQHVHLLHKSSDDRTLLDPRGPSLWMGTSGSGTQCHYDVANNVILQLHGSKRVRVWRPSDGVYRLHTYPDAHPRSRKSQVDLDVDDDDDSTLRWRYPHYYCTHTPLRPTLDVILRPGDALYLPAFWFHHVENGQLPGLISGVDTVDVIDGPSVSLNSFALSKPMMIARKIFASASRPMDATALDEDDDDTMERRHRRVLAVLGALGTQLIRELNVVDYGEELGFIRKYLLEARYIPLVIIEDNNRINKEPLIRREVSNYDLTNEQKLAVESCIERIMPDFRQLLGGSHVGEDINNGNGSDGVGIALLVGLHLLELWAVEIVGPALVAKAWDDVLVLNGKPSANK